MWRIKWGNEIMNNCPLSQSLGRIKRFQESIEEKIAKRVKRQLEDPNLPVLVIPPNEPSIQKQIVDHFQKESNLVVIFPSATTAVGKLLPFQQKNVKRILKELTKKNNLV